ncbi:S8 family serine peptidase [Streptomyces sp. NPDC020802]|uniref:S8 family serine peptidase n=1 Tax=Streptomyces sp. NPDC020802 TaxID=3365094 RepID=UPI0037BB61A9
MRGEGTALLQQNPGPRTHAGRRTTSLLAPLLVGGLLLTSGPIAPVLPADPAVAQLPDTAQKSYSDGIYLVQLADQPVATYSRTAPAPGKRLRTQTEAVRDYTDRLAQAREKVLDTVDGVQPLYTYDLLLNGFAAKLTARQATELASTPGVVSLTRNETRRPTDTETVGIGATTTTTPRTATTAEPARSGTTQAPSAAPPAKGTLAPSDTAGFLGLKKPGGLYSKFPGGQKNAGVGTILGVVDSGIDPDIPSLEPLPEPRPDAKIIAQKWKGSCDPGEDSARKVTCNNKLIGAQYFNKGIPESSEDHWASPLDLEGHGTHIATTAAGDYNVPADVPDTGISGRMSGLAPAARVASYKVCSRFALDCATVDVVAALEKAVADGVDVISFSLGTSFDDQGLASPEYAAMFNAAKAGVFFAAAAGNSGRGAKVTNSLPWVTTVAASNHDLAYRTTVTLGNGAQYTGAGAYPSGVPSAPLVDGAKAARNGVDPADAARCLADSLDPAKAKGALVLCARVKNARGENTRIEKSAAVKAAGGVGLVMYYTRDFDDLVVDPHTLPTVYLTPPDGQAVKTYSAGAGSGATAEMGAAFTERPQAPKVAGYSSGGPDVFSGGDLLKPDVMAPGMDITAGTAPGSGDGLFKGSAGLMGGTSAATPHVAGLALLLRSLHPDWSPMEVKSALMTSATTKDNKGKPIGRFNVDGPATPLDYGAGHVVPNTADDPGLVYDSTSADWTAYLCAIGGPRVTGADACATATKTDASDLNTPSISVGDLLGRQTVTRTVTNVARTTGVYTATLQTPPGYTAEVSPKRLVVKPGESATYRVTFTRTDAAYGDWRFGSVTFSDGRHQVHSPVALRATRFSAPAEVTGKGTTGSTTLTSRASWDGTLHTTVNGLYADTVRTGTLTGTTPDPLSPPSTAVAESEVTVDEGIELVRVAMLPNEYVEGSDVDLWVLDKDGNLLSNPTAGNDEHVDLTEPGTYTVYVVQYSLPQGTTSQPYTLHTWRIGKNAEPDHTATVTPAEQQVTMGKPAEVKVSWQNLPADRSYLGVLHYGDGIDTAGTTFLTVTP